MRLRVLYGGTFDPVHDGHIAVARHARDALVAEIRLMPAADPPHKDATHADARARTRMLQLAIAGQPGLRVDTRELRRDGASYTVDTLRALRADVGMEAPWAILVGADSFLQLPEWKEWRALPGLAHIVVAERPGSPVQGCMPPALAEATQGRWVEDARALHAAPCGLFHALRQPLSPESSSELRRRIAAGEPWRGWVAPAVADYIVEHGLYA